MRKKLFNLVFSIMLCSLFFFTLGGQAMAAETTVTESDVTATLSVDKDEYSFGEEVTYTLTVENNRTGWTSAQTKFKYSNEGLKSYDGNDLDNNLARLDEGESATITGILIGEDVEVGSSHPASSSNGSFVKIIIIIAILVVAAVLVFFIIKKKKTKQALTVLVIVASLFTAFTFSDTTAFAEEANSETVTLRPYVKFTYDGQEVMVRATLNLTMVQPVIKFDSSLRDNAETITCHDPSIFKDTDGKYYVFGSFLCNSVSEDLHDWTCLDSQFQGTFTDEVKDQIRAWNDDESAGDWNSYLWAPDVIYNTEMGKYCMYLSANGDDWKSNIVLLTADSVEGPYDYAGTVVYGGFNEETYSETDAPDVLGDSELPKRYIEAGVDNKHWGDEWPNCIDPCVFYDEEGNLWMSYGSWSGGIFMLSLDESTGLRDYSVTYDCNEHSDAYFGTKIAGGSYVSGEASYIQHIGDYYYLFISYGNLEEKGGYNIRVFRSDRPDGDYVDELGNDPYYDDYLFNYNQSKGVRLFGSYKWRTMNVGQVSQGHNSAFVDDDGKAYIVFHTRTTDGTEGHYVKVHQLFVNSDGWLVAAPYFTNGETLEDSVSMDDVVGDYDVIIHDLDVDYENLDTNKPCFITLNSDGTITGDYEGTFEINGSDITLEFNGDTYVGVTLSEKIENTSVETQVFTALGRDTQITVWGSKQVEE